MKQRSDATPPGDGTCDDTTSSLGITRPGARPSVVIEVRDRDTREAPVTRSGKAMRSRCCCFLATFACVSIMDGGRLAAVSTPRALSTPRSDVGLARDRWTRLPSPRSNSFRGKRQRDFVRSLWSLFRSAGPRRRCRSRDQKNRRRVLCAKRGSVPSYATVRFPWSESRGTRLQVTLGRHPRCPGLYRRVRTGTQNSFFTTYIGICIRCFYSVKNIKEKYNKQKNVWWRWGAGWASVKYLPIHGLRCFLKIIKKKPFPTTHIYY